MSNSKKKLRQKLYINPEVQGQLLIRLTIHWCFYLASILLFLSVWAAVRHPDELAYTMIYKSFAYFAPAIFASIILLPLFAYDYLRQSNKIVGPIYRLQTEMKKLRNGEDIKPLRFRDGDHWMELAEDFNKLSAVTMQNRQQLNGEESNHTETSSSDDELQPVHAS